MAKVKNMVDDLYNRSIISEFMVSIVEPEVYVDNIWAIPELV